MKDLIVKWIYDNANDIRKTAVALGIIDLVILGLAVISGEFISLLSILPRIVVAEVLFFVPCVLVVKNCK